MEKNSRNQSEHHALTSEGEINQVINMAIKLAKKKIKDGTASSQIITHFLNLATAKTQLEAEKLRADVALSNAKVDQIQSDKEMKAAYDEVIKAIKGYQGRSDEEDEDDDGYYDY